jgi:hypothetical protein
MTEFHNPLVPEPQPGEEVETEEDETNQEPANQQEQAPVPGEQAGQPAAAVAEDAQNAQNVLKAPPFSPAFPPAAPQAAPGA